MEVYKITTLVCLIVLFMEYVTTALKLPTLQGENIVLVSDSIALDYIHLHRQRRSAPNEPPHTIHAHFSINNDNLKLKFSRTDNQPRKIPVHQVRFGMPVLRASEGNSECVSIYIDFDSKESAMVDFCESTRDTPAMLIELPINNTQHVIMTSSMTADPGHITHKLYRVHEPESWTFKDYNLPDTPQGAKLNDVSTSKRRRRADVSTLHTVELLLIIDYSLYTFWYDQTSGTNREQQASDMIRNFYAFNVAAMNSRYQGLASAGLNIGVELVGIRLMTTPQDSPWIEGNLDAQTLGPRGSFNGKTALSDFDNWIANQKATDPNFPKYDHAQLLTARDLQLDGSIGAAGFANLGAICTGKSQSIAEDHFNFLSITIQTHELGHSLGAVHDGEGNTCRGSDLFIMAAINGVLQGETARNPWQFSLCSASAISNKILLLNSNSGGNDNCLVTNDNNDEIAPTGDLIGQRFGPDEQCKLAFGSGSFVCKTRHLDTDNYANMCTGLWCAVIDNLNNCTMIIPADGTTCGDKMWCINGRCEYSDNAPAANEACMFGDQIGTFAQTTCSDIVTSDLSRCYETSIRRLCCSSCEEHKTNIDGCQYGDTADCSLITAANAWNCYNTSFSASQCCKTCYDLKSTDLPSSCAYGDSLADCRAEYAICNRYPVGCCKTCEDFITTKSSTKSATTRSTPSTTQKSGSSNSSSGPETWVIIVGAAGGAVVLIGAIVGIILLCRRSNTDPKPSRPRRHHRNRHRNDGYVREHPPRYERHMGSDPRNNSGGYRTRY